METIKKTLETAEALKITGVELFRQEKDRSKGRNRYFRGKCLSEQIFRINRL
jgi:hypothetical protein